MLNDNQRRILEEVNLPLLLLLEAEELNSDDEPDASRDQEQPEDNNDQPEDNNDQQEEQPQPTEEELFTYELEGTEDKFLQFTLYDKLTDIASKIDILQDNIKNDTSAENMDLLSNLDHYAQYIGVLNELIFTISTPVVYKLLGQIELELIDILEVYNSSLEKNIEQDKIKG